ncbi:hypothetical protein G6F17_010261 [Rhizopus arrhizus]|nr:hypothetical protein G6F17_010261 [Rhizopus arrhizus]
MEVIPLQRLYDEAEAEESGSLEDSLVRRLLHWFKNDFFVWVNNAPCDYCSNDWEHLTLKISSMEHIQSNYTNAQLVDRLLDFLDTMIRESCWKQGEDDVANGLTVSRYAAEQLEQMPELYMTQLIMFGQKSILSTNNVGSIVILVRKPEIRTSCALSMKKLEKISVARNSEETLKKRKETILQWLADREMGFENNCVFLDEAGFNLHMTRTRSWSKKGAPAKTTVPASKGTTITILGAISSAGVIDISLRKPIMVSGAKKRRVDGKVVTTTAKVGTRAEHYLNYLSNVMDVLDRNNMRGFYLQRL